MVVLYVVIQFYPCFEFYILWFFSKVMYDNKFERQKKQNLNQGGKWTTTYIYIILGVPSHTSHLRTVYV